MFFNIRGAGQLGVMLFFVLSGFLMSYLYGNRHLNHGTLVSYSLKRFFRVYPAYSMVIILSWFIYQSHPGFQYKMTDDQLIRHLLLNGQLSILWTIPVEMKFYLIFPLVALLFHWVQGAFQKVYASFILLTLYLLADPGGNKISIWPYIEYFLGGVFSGYLFHAIAGSRPNNIERNSAIHQKIINGTFLITLCFIFFSIPSGFANIFGFSYDLWSSSSYFVPLFCLCVLSCSQAKGIAKSIFASPIARFIGQISFSLYLIHIPAMSFVQSELSLPNAMELALGISFAILMAWTLYVSVENPCRRFGAWLAIQLGALIAANSLKRSV